MPANYYRIFPGSVDAAIDVPIYDLRVSIDAAAIIQGGAIHRAFVAPYTKVPFVRIVTIGHLDAGHASLIVNVGESTVSAHEVGADCWNIIDGGVIVNPFSGDCVVHAHSRTMTRQSRIPYLDISRRLTCTRSMPRRTI